MNKLKLLSHPSWTGLGVLVGIITLLFAILTFIFTSSDKKTSINQSFNNTGKIQQTHGNNSDINN